MDGVVRATFLFPCYHLRHSSSNLIKTFAMTEKQEISQPHDSQSRKMLQHKEAWGITPRPFVEDTSHELGRSHSQRVDYLEGLR